MENISETVLSIRLETIRDIGTDAKWQLLCIRNSAGYGIGKIMLETVLKAAKESGFEQAELEVISDNQNAITLYEKLGFQKYGTFPDNMKYADGHYASADWMMKKL